MPGLRARKIEGMVMLGRRDEKSTYLEGPKGPKAAWDRRLSDDEVVEFVDNPFQMWKAYKPPIWERFKAWLRGSDQ